MATEYKRNGKSLKSRFMPMLIQKFGEVCWYCGIALENRPKHIDHIKPVRIGGKDDIENLALSCKFCNFAKWYSYLDEFYSWIEHIRSDKFKARIHVDDEIHPTSNLWVEKGAFHGK